ncbi:hypothetical protein [Sphingopyxis sp. NJF-3]
MANDPTLAERATLAAEALVDINAFHGIMALLEARLLSEPHANDERKIISICRSGAAKALGRYDGHMAAIKEGWEQ